MTGTLTIDFTLSILVPVYNEKELLPFFIEHIRQKMSKKHELIFIDGGSNDGTWEWLKNQKTIKAFQSEKGRAKQLNKGAQEATQNILYFVHVDTLLPQDFDLFILKAITNKAHAGSFQLQFTPSNFWLNIAARGSHWNHLLCRGGDQTLFVTKPLFKEIGGFDEKYTVCEDINFIKKIYRKTKFYIIPYDVHTSARRFLNNGTLRLLFHFGILHFLHWIGAGPKFLKRYYLLNVS